MIAIIIARVVTIILMSLTFAVVIISGFALFLGYGSYYNVLLIHRFAAIAVIIIVIVHFFLRYDKFKKLFVDFFSVIKTGSIVHKRTKEIMFSPLAELTLNELCELYEIDVRRVVGVLKSRRMKEIQIYNTLEFIAKSNNEDAVRLFEMIIKEKM